MDRKNAAEILLPLAAILSLSPWVSSGAALVIGAALALSLGNPYAPLVKENTHRLLAISVVGLGAGMDLEVVGRVGMQGIGYTVVGILTTAVVGTRLGRLLNIEEDTSLLITIGTAICGGSAIAAVASVIRAKHHNITVALGTVFMLNAAALLIFPPIGHQLALSEQQFGLWSALAIHDTSSVVGSAIQYGPHAVEVGTTVKLARALWIIPAAMLIGHLRSRRGPGAESAGKAKKPWFILGFLLVAALFTYFPTLQPLGHTIESIARRTMVLTLFLIGSGLTLETIKAVGVRPFILGGGLWLVMASGTLGAVYLGVIR